MDQAQLASSVGVTQSTWSRIERGESMMNVEQLYIASQSLEISLEDLFRETEVVLNSYDRYGIPAASDPESKTPKVFGLTRATEIKVLDMNINLMLKLAEPE